MRKDIRLRNRDIMIVVALAKLFLDQEVLRGMAKQFEPRISSFFFVLLVAVSF